MEFFSSQKPDVYRCYGYGRLSRRDKEKARRNNDESNSIINQELLCKGWSHHLIHMTAVHLWQNGT